MIEAVKWFTSLKTKSNAMNTLVYLPVKDVFSLLHYASVVSVSDLEVNTVCSFVETLSVELNANVNTVCRT